MPVSVIVGGQFGSEGKGKVAALLAEAHPAKVVVRCGGPNSGHTVYDAQRRKYVFRQIPTACLTKGVALALAPGSYIDVDLLLEEVRVSGLNPSSLIIDERAVVITDSHRREELSGELVGQIGSTGSGTGAAVLQRISRSSNTVFAKDVPQLLRYLGDAVEFIHRHLDCHDRVIVEGTQGYGLSLLHAHSYPFVTARDTTAAGFISECGISPFQVDDIVMVIRAFPIRVGGDSGPLPKEIDWLTISEEAGKAIPTEFTSVTKKIRRVARFDPTIVCEAIRVNRPSRIVLNHVDYIQPENRAAFVSSVEDAIGAKVDFVGCSPWDLERFESGRFVELLHRTI